MVIRLVSLKRLWSWLRLPISGQCSNGCKKQAAPSQCKSSRTQEASVSTSSTLAETSWLYSNLVRSSLSGLARGRSFGSLGPSMLFGCFFYLPRNNWLLLRGSERILSRRVPARANAGTKQPSVRQPLQKPFILSYATAGLITNSLISATQYTEMPPLNTVQSRRQIGYRPKI
jgi:hypothetical protein